MACPAGAGNRSRPEQRALQKADVNDRPFLAIMFAFFVLLAVASWQFYLLVAK